ncbi:hypothetical protein M404DRAFT_999106 [Pisolithus tinctorius Marx 270]|uniref:Uncharacterized protein n=1 Tax=Pisolithus tinctorius Marx 270 TaxID=870435 RepID=A0A0C3P014_PISTI|nr:hypothetical protein M404DRAFT_999106 [Pisolithus tinctorius Marx 270]
MRKLSKHGQLQGTPTTLIKRHFAVCETAPLSGTRAQDIFFALVNAGSPHTNIYKRQPYDMKNT